VDLGSPLGRATQWVAASSGFRAVGPKVVPPVDRLLSRLTGGRVALSGSLVPSLVLETTGAKTGLTRTSPLACLPEDDGSFLVVGSNFGRDRHPAWTANLKADPEATVTYRGRTIPVRATLLGAGDKAAVWPRLTAVWPNYDRYTEVSGRDLRVFRLVPTSAAPG
jgi:deazaflavin-dependent oxidoreductase (nitroreductase family)